MFHVSRKMMCDLWKAKRTFDKKKKKKILPLEIYLPLRAGVKN